MGEVVRFCDPDADLERPKWFYKECELLTAAICEQFADLMNDCPFGEICYDDVWFSLAETPVRLMALKEGDDEIEKFICMSALHAAVMKVVATPPAQP